jgi:hypothetical protein
MYPTILFMQSNLTLSGLINGRLSQEKANPKLSRSYDAWYVCARPIHCRYLEKGVLIGK